METTTLRSHGLLECLTILVIQAGEIRCSDRRSLQGQSAMRASKMLPAMDLPCRQSHKDEATVPALKGGFKTATQREREYRAIGNKKLYRINSGSGERGWTSY